jgi:hypothetical protein
MADQNEKDVEQAQEKKQSTYIRRILADAYAFVRSAELNRAIATVTIEDLMEDQIKRNGESGQSNYAKYNPYIYDPDNPPPKGTEGAEPTNFLSGTDTSRPPKIVYIQALKNELTAVIKEVKSKDPIEIANSGEYVDAADTPGETTG